MSTVSNGVSSYTTRIQYLAVTASVSFVSASHVNVNRTKYCTPPPQLWRLDTVRFEAKIGGWRLFAGDRRAPSPRLAGLLPRPTVWNRQSLQHVLFTDQLYHGVWSGSYRRFLGATVPLTSDIGTEALRNRAMRNSTIMLVRSCEV